MSRKYIKTSDFTLVQNLGTSINVCFDLQPAQPEGYATCGYVTFYKKQHPTGISLDVLKPSVLSALREQTDDTILRGFKWENKTVILNDESKFNFLSVLTMSQMNPNIFPQTFKLNDEDYHTFQNVDEYLAFIAAVQQHLSDTYAAGWAAEQALDWDAYEKALSAIYEK